MLCAILNQDKSEQSPLKKKSLPWRILMYNYSEIDLLQKVR